MHFCEMSIKDPSTMIFNKLGVDQISLFYDTKKALKPKWLQMSKNIYLM